MGSTDAKKAKKKKSRKVGRTLAASLSVPQTPLSTLDSEEIEQMTQLMDADDVNEVIVPAFSPNPFISGHQCLLCRCDRPHLPKQNGDVTAGEEGSDGGSSVSQLPPWVCHECRKTVEEEEKRTEIPMSALLEPDLRPVLPLLSEVGGNEPVTENGTLCQCKACTERRHIEVEQEREAQSLLHCWTELRHVIHCVYHQRALTPTSSDDAGNVAVSTADIEKAKEFVHRLCVRDPHKLFQRVDEQGQEYVLEVKKRLLQQLAIGSKTSAQQAKVFLAMLLDEYTNLCSTAKTLAVILAELEQLHLKQFHVTCEFYSKHLFHALIYMEEDIQNRLHMIIPQLSLGSSGNEEVHDDTSSDLLQRYLKFDDEMSAVSVVWRECQQFIERYNDEQAVLTAKRKMLKEDWEFFKQQRKLLQQQQQQQQEEQTKCSAASPSSSPHTVELVEAQFTHMMERILQGAKPTTSEYHCPNCNRKRCPCDECSISHMITCGIINPDLLDQLHQPGAAGGDSNCMAAQVKFPSELYTTLNVRPPSMSSTCSSSGSESPIIIDPERLTLPFDEDTLDLGEDDLGEDEDSRSGNSDDESTADEDDTQRSRLDCAIVTTTSDVNRETHTMDKLDGLEHRAADLERAASYAASLQAYNNTTFSCGFTQQPHTMASCECISCIFQPEAQQVRVTEESQCQCHACLQQQRQKQQQQQQHGVATETTLPQHFPVLPQPSNQALHLYPHIHGANIMHPIVAAAAAVTTLQPTQLAGQHPHPHPHPHPLLQPQLYELHSPLPQQQLVLKAVTSCVSATTATPTTHIHQQQLNHFGHYVDSKDVRLAVSNDKLYHACLGWDNATINGAHLMLSSQFNLPPSPPFANDVSLVTHSSTAVTLPEDQFASVVPTSTTPLFQQCSLATAPSTSSTSRQSGTQCGASVVFSAPVSGLDLRVPDTQAASVKRTLLNPSSQTMPIHNFTPDVCMKHNPFMYMTNHSSLTSTPHTTTISTSQPTAAAADGMTLSDDMIRSSGVTGTGCCDSIASMSHQDQMYALAHGHMQATGGTTKQMVNMSHVTRMQQQGCATAPQGVPAPRSAPPPHHHTHSVSTTASGHVDTNNISDVSSTAGSMCLEADSCAHNDDNCDSNDDSCSEQSSSTSTSNQKDGKYCDCCYCEFFGHSTPPTLPTSRNYAEMRDRLRLRLKQRNEARTEKDKETLTPASPPKNEIVDQRELDELLRFINGAKDDAASPVEVLMAQTPADNKATAKAAKRARQKQRKADEKAKKEAEEERQAKLERLRQLEQERAYQQLLKKKRSRHKEPEKTEAAGQGSTPTTSSVPNGGTSCKVAAPGHKLRTVTVVSQAQAAWSEKPHQSVGAVITTNGQLRLSSPGVTTSCSPSSCQASVKKSCQSVASTECKSLRSNDCTAAPCTSSQLAAKSRRQQPQQADRVKKVAGKNQQQPGGSTSSSSNNVENGSPKRTPSLKMKRSGDASDVQAQNRRNEQASHTGQTISRPQPCGQAKVARQNCVAGSSTHKSSAVSNGPIASKSCTAANCTSMTGRGGVDNKNHHITGKEQTACLTHFMQQHQMGLFNTGPPAKMCHNTTDTTASHSTTNSVGRKKGFKLYQTMEPASHHPATQLPIPSVTPRSGRPATCSNNHVGQRLDTGQSGQSSMANNHGPLSVSSPATFENHAWKLEKKAVPPKHPPPLTAAASRSKCDLERSPRTNEQNSGSINKNKKSRRKKPTEDLSSLDEIFLPKEDVENGELDEFEREIEEFKRFCLDSTPAEKREKVQVTMNMKDIFSKKKSGLLA